MMANLKWTPTPTITRMATLPNGDLAAVIGVTTPDGETYSYHRYLVGDHGHTALDFSSGPYSQPMAPTELFLETVEREGAA